MEINCTSVLREIQFRIIIFLFFPSRNSPGEMELSMQVWKYGLLRSLKTSDARIVFGYLSENVPVTSLQFQVEKYINEVDFGIFVISS